MTPLALEFGRVLGELERAGSSVFEDCAREHEPFDVEERLLDRAGARGTAGVSRGSWNGARLDPPAWTGPCRRRCPLGHPIQTLLRPRATPGAHGRETWNAGPDVRPQGEGGCACALLGVAEPMSGLELIPS
jgi:hypothetical protein